MPFRNDLSDVYRDIKDVVQSLRLKCWRADEVSRAGNVFGMILEDIKNADVIIADLTGRNANVFYETASLIWRKVPSRSSSLPRAMRMSPSISRRYVYRARATAKHRDALRNIDVSRAALKRVRQRAMAARISA